MGRGVVRRMHRVLGLALVGMLASPLLPLHAGAQTEKTLPYSGKTVLVTGSTDGLGREVARALASGGARVIVHGRNAERGNALVSEIEKEGKGSAVFYAADFASLTAVRAFADTIAAHYPKLDVLINNAGVLVPAGSERRTSADGHELHFAVNYLAGWVLVHRLKGSLTAAAPSRVINISSISASPIEFDDVMLERVGAARRGYGQSKLAQVMMTLELAPEFSAAGITMVAVHPATLMNTSMVRSSGMPVRSTVDEGRESVMQLVDAPTLAPGTFYNGTRIGQPHPQAMDAGVRAQLRALSTQLTKVP